MNTSDTKMPEVPAILLEELKRIKGAEAILLTGSRAIGKATKNSDWDFFVMLKDGMPRWRKTYKVDGTWLELLCNDEKQIKKEFEEDKKEGRGVTTYMFATGYILRDSSSGILQHLTKLAKRNWEKRPTKLSQRDLNFINYDISTYIQDIEDCLHDNNPALLLVNYAVNELVNYDFKLRGEWLPRPKDRLAVFAKESKEAYRLVQEINQSEDWKIKAELAIKFGNMIGKKFNLPLDGQLYIPPKPKELK